MTRPCILHICETARGGVGSYVNLFAEFDSGEFRSVVVAPLQHSDHIDPRLDCVTFRYPRRGPGSLLRMVRTALQALWRTRPDVIFLHSTFSLAMLVVLRSLFVRTPIIFCAHGWAVSRYEDAPLRRWIARNVEGRLCGLADVVVNISASEKALARDLGYKGRHLLLENAVRDRRPNTGRDPFRTGPAGTTAVPELNLLFIGRLDRQKGLDILLSAFARISERRPDIRLHVVGESVVGDNVQEQVPPNVHLHGWVGNAEIDDWYAAADAVIVPSRWEGFGLVVAEAMRNGTPALVSRRGELPALVRPGCTGEVFDLDPEALAGMFLALDRTRLRRMRDDCRATYEERFSFTRFRKRFLTVLSGLDRPSAQAWLKEPNA